MSVGAKASRRRNFSRNERGAVTIEFVVTLPLFLAALAFSFEFGRIFVAHQTTVSHVRSASRYLSRSDLSTANLAVAEAIIRTGQPAGGTEKNYLTATNATIAINESYATFSDVDFNANGKTLRIFTRVEFPLSIFGFVDADTAATIPFVVVEDLRHVGV